MQVLDAIRVEHLTREGFAPFGDVITAQEAHNYPINGGNTTRFHDLARVDIDGANPRPLISIFRTKPFALPVTIAMMERHPLGSQAFMPLHDLPWLAVVAPDEGGRPGEPRAFVVRPGSHGLQGVNYARNVWHHPLIALKQQCDFLVIDRGGSDNLEEYPYPEPCTILPL